ncbi:MAG: riboflavin biosynthesis protein RibF [Muribaculaceae bacterium]|nr:riboflavin biosynthesis protein RibF [Muribaculaceae bacterium]
MSGACANAAAVGMFDGVHLGHRDIMHTVAECARARGGHPVVLTFREHPVSVLRPDEAPRLLTTPEEKEALIRAFLPDAEVRMLSFAEMRGVSAGDFLRRLCADDGVGTMVMGYDNRFGCDGPREREAYDELGRTLGMRVVHVSPLAVGAVTASSTAIRRLILAGDVAAAAELLDRPYSVSGTVVHGRRLGRTLGFPTANLQPDPCKLLPAAGVYEADATVDGLGRWPAMVNIGRRPTVDHRADAPLSVEAHLIGADADMYGRRMTLEFRRRLRDERRFASPQELKAQLERDMAEISRRMQ